MIQVFDFFVMLLNMGITVLSMPRFSIGGMEVSFFDLMIGTIIIGLVISVFWKGARV